MPLTVPSPLHPLPCHPQQLVAHLRHLLRRHAVDPIIAKEPASLGLFQQMQPHLDIAVGRLSIRADGISVGPLAADEILLAQDRGHARPQPRLAGVGGGQHQPGQPRVHRHRRHPFTQRRDPAGVVDRAKLAQQILTRRQGLGRGFFKPGKSADIGFAERVQIEQRAGEVDRSDLRQIERRHLQMFRRRPQPNAFPLRRSPGAPGALCSGGLADALERQRIQPAHRIEPRHPGEAAVDHRADPVDRQRRLGDVRR